MATCSLGSFTTSTPIHQQYDSGFCDNSPQSTSSSRSSIGENFDTIFSPVRKNLFGKRNNSENIPDNLFSLKRRILSRSSTFSRRDANSNTETPTRSCASSDKPVRLGFGGVERSRRVQQLFFNRISDQPDGNDSGFHVDIPEISGSRGSEGYGIPLLKLVENLNPENSKEESLAYFIRSLVSETKNFPDLLMSDIQHLYYIYRFQRIGLKPPVADIDLADIDFWKEHPLIKDVNDKSEMFLSPWKDRLERISADLKNPPEIDFLSQLHIINASPLVSKILSYLSGLDLQNASNVSQMWRKLVLRDKDANKARLAYLKKWQKLRKEMEIKNSINPFQRPPNHRILGIIENAQKEQLRLKKTIKEVNFGAFIEVGKSGARHRPMKCPSCRNLSLQNKQVITKYNCLFCGHEFCCNCLKPYVNWHFCASTYFPTEKPPANGKRYLRRL